MASPASRVEPDTAYPISGNTSMLIDVPNSDTACAAHRNMKSRFFRIGRTEHQCPPTLKDASRRGRPTSAGGPRGRVPAYLADRERMRIDGRDPPSSLRKAAARSALTAPGSRRNTPTTPHTLLCRGPFFGSASHSQAALFAKGRNVRRTLSRRVRTIKLIALVESRPLRRPSQRTCCARAVPPSDADVSARTLSWASVRPARADGGPGGFHQGLVLISLVQRSSDVNGYRHRSSLSTGTLASHHQPQPTVRPDPSRRFRRTQSQCFRGPDVERQLSAGCRLW